MHCCVQDLGHDLVQMSLRFKEQEWHMLSAGFPSKRCLCAPQTCKAPVEYVVTMTHLQAQAQPALYIHA